MTFRNAGVPPALFRWKPLFHLEAAAHQLEADGFVLKFCLTGGSPLIHQEEPDFSPAKKHSLAGWALAQGARI
jgi:hypothetical protein